MHDLTQVVTSKDHEGSALRSSLAKAELNIQLLQHDQEKKLEEIMELNKARQELKSYVEEREREFKLFDTRMEDKDAQIKEIMLQMDDMDIQKNELLEQIKKLEQDKVKQKTEFDNKMRLLNDRVSMVNSQLMDEMEGKRQWQERFITENKSTSHLNSEIQTQKAKVSDLQAKCNNQATEVGSLKSINEALMLSKKELQLSLNTYQGKCESYERELDNLNKINEESELHKQREFR